jgi:hypothetical protein
MTNLETRVARGAAWLDTFDPDWVDAIDLNALDLQSCEQCVLGQRFGRYDHGVTLLASDTGRIDMHVRSEFGFSTWGIEKQVSYDDLTMRWRKYITRRRAHASQPEEVAVAQ